MGNHKSNTNNTNDTNRIRATLERGKKCLI